jgi:polar amino acid transport system substrate-binding protein
VRLFDRLFIAGSLAVLMCAVPAWAACSRTIVVPVAPTGFSVIIDGGKVSGVFPDTLRELGKKAGCEFAFPVIPRARISYMFLQSGEADLLLPASRSDERDRQADFVPMMKLKMALVSNKASTVRAASVAELLAHPDWRGVVVRSYVFGNEYNALMAQLDAQRRVSYAAAPLMVARMMKAGRADFTVVAPTIFLSSLNEDPAMAGFADQVRFSALDGLPPTDSGIYVSRRSLSQADQAQLHQLLRQAAQGTLWKWFQHYYPAHIAAFAIRHHEPVAK